MPEQSPIAPKSGDVFGVCRACGNRMSLANTKAYVEDLERDLAKTKQKLADARLTISAMDRRIKDLMEEKK